MGKNLRQQARGKGGPRYRSPGHRFPGAVSYRYIPANVKHGIVENIIDAPGRYVPLAVVNFDGKKVLQIPHEGIRVNQQINFETPETGNILQLRSITEGTKIYNIELNPGDGGKLCRSSGSFSMLTTKEGNRCTLLLPSGKKKVVSADCRATIGTVAGFGRLSKPFMKAGTKYYAMRAVNRLWPRTSGISMNPVDHPFGGKTKPGKHKTVSRDMPPGKKVGSISASRMGKKKGKA
ncbi:MAG: 50S ribosomal protein L2 [Candidatus Aenigmarchaeota archaeon]|nr:50S ribosomal protein L2 [Candidatus Aenigmarchaeota archaeon]